MSGIVNEIGKEVAKPFLKLFAVLIVIAVLTWLSMGNRRKGRETEIQSKNKIEPELRIEVIGDKVDTLYIYRDPVK